MSVKKVPLEYNEDQKGRGFEIQGLQKSKTFQGKSIEDVVIQSINPKKERGGHYHKRKTEWFIALRGEAFLIWTEKTNPEETDLKTMPLKEDFENPYVLEVPPMISHWVRNDSKDVFLMASFSTEEYNSTDPDSFKVKIGRN